MLRSLLSFLILTCAFLTLPSAHAEQSCEPKRQIAPIEQRYFRGVIFQFSKCDGPKSYVMGTLHADSPKITPIYKDAMSVIAATRSVGFEFVEDENTSAIAIAHMFLPSESAPIIPSVISDVQLRKLETVLGARTGIPKEAVPRMYPWSAAIMLQYPKHESDGIALDARMQRAAAEMGKPLFGLETPQEQYAIFDAIPADNQVHMLKDALDTLEDMDAINANFIQAYVDRDLKKLMVLADDSFALGTDPWLENYMRQKLLIARNHVMVERMQGELKAGNSFVAVGALHLMGEDGILPLLESQGYHVDVVK